jgi:hypothetical protein
MVELRAWFDENRKTIVRGLAFLGVLVGLAAGQLYLIFGIGPQQTLERYVSAVEEGDFAALDDESLFPGAQDPGNTMAVNFRDSSATSAVSFEIDERNGAAATAKIDLGSSTYQLELSSQIAFKGLFFIAEWIVLSEPQMLQIQIHDSLQAKQEVTLPGTSSILTIGDLNDGPGFVDSFVHVLPGLYSAEIDGLGFFEDTVNEITVTAGSSPSSLNLAPAVRAVKSGSNSKAAAKAKNAVKDCIRSRCSNLPKLGAYDFNLWSQYPYSTSDFNNFNKSFRFDSCTEISTVAISATKVRKNYSCDYTAKGHLYVGYYYYYGYYSDYYYYWNLYDTKSLSMTVHVDIQTNEAGTKENVGKAVVG